MSEFRIEKDSMGEVKVPAQAYYSAQAQRAVENFPISGQPLPKKLVRALGLVKLAAAIANRDLGKLKPEIADPIILAAREVAQGKLDDEFPIDVYQTGSGTSSNMNANEVIATLASRRLGQPVHPNDHVNASQSSNDVFPSAIQLAATQLIVTSLLPALSHLADALELKASEFAVYGRGGALDRGKRSDQLAGQRLTRNREVLHRTLGLRTPERVGGHQHFAHGVVLDTHAIRRGGHRRASG